MCCRSPKSPTHARGSSLALRVELSLKQSGENLRCSSRQFMLVAACVHRFQDAVFAEAHAGLPTAFANVRQGDAGDRLLADQAAAILGGDGEQELEVLA